MTQKQSDNTELTEQEAAQAAADLTKILSLPFVANEGNAYDQNGGQYPALASIKNHSIYYAGDVSDAQLRLLADIMPFGGFSISDGYKEVGLEEGAKKKKLVLGKVEGKPCYVSQEVDAKLGDTVTRATGKTIVINRVDLEKLHARAEKTDEQRANAGEVAALLKTFTGESFIPNGLAIDSEKHFDSPRNNLNNARGFLSLLAEEGALRVELQSNVIMQGEPQKPKEITRLFIPEFDLAKIKEAIPEVQKQLAALLTQATGRDWSLNEAGNLATPSHCATDSPNDPDMMNDLVARGIIAARENIMVTVDNLLITPTDINLGALKAVVTKLENAKEATALLTQILGYEWTANGTTLSAAKPDSQDHSDCANLYTLENDIFRKFPEGLDNPDATTLTIDIDQINLEKLRLRANTAKQEIRVGNDVIHAGQTGPKPKETGIVRGVGGDNGDDVD